MSHDDIDKITLPLLLEFAANLPASPRVFARLSKLVENEDTALEIIADLLKMDPGLAAQVLRVTNSAYYGAAVKVNDLETAISRIGFNEINKVLGTVVAHECFYQALPVYGLSATQFSDQSVNVAVTAEIVAKRTGADSSGPYICGLLHAIGKLAINIYLERMEQIFNIAEVESSKLLHEVEFEILGITHWRAGYELLRHWQFEPEIWQPIKNQTSPQAAPSYVRGTAILTLALWIPDQLEGFESDEPLPANIKWALGKLGIDALDIPMLIDDARFEINDRRNMMMMLL